MAHFVDGLRTLFRQPATALLVIIESLMIWLCDALVLWLVVLSLAAPLSLPATAFVALTVDVLAAVPLTPGGVGQIDAAYAALLALLALPALHVGTIVLIVRFITYWSFLVFSGLVTLAAGFGSLLSPALATNASHAGAQHTGTQHTGAQHTGAQHTGAQHTGAQHTGAQASSPAFPYIPNMAGLADACAGKAWLQSHRQARTPALRPYDASCCLVPPPLLVWGAPAPLFRHASAGAPAVSPGWLFCRQLRL